VARGKAQCQVGAWTAVLERTVSAAVEKIAAGGQCGEVIFSLLGGIAA
jgi:hypothetical protein